MERNNTSFPIEFVEKLRIAMDQLQEEENPLSFLLRYYQNLVVSIFSDPDLKIKKFRGMLIDHEMGLGKTMLSLGIIIALKNWRPILITKKSLHGNWKEAIEKLRKLINEQGHSYDAEEYYKLIKKRLRFVSLDAHNAITQLARAIDSTVFSKKSQDTNLPNLENRLLIFDEAHNFFRAIINSSNENSNARRIYKAIMETKNIRLLFLTGTPVSKDPFELVPCFNMLAGYDILPVDYQNFYEYYTNPIKMEVIHSSIQDEEFDEKDKTLRSKIRKGEKIKRSKKAKTIADMALTKYEMKNVAHFQNRIVGFISHAALKFMRDPRSMIRKKGGFPEELPIIVEYCPMSESQYKGYLIAKSKESTSNLSKPSSNTPLSLPQSSNISVYFVYSRQASIYYPIEDEFTEEASSKCPKIIKNLKKCPGPAIVYSQFIGAGNEVVAEYLQNDGYEEYGSSGKCYAFYNGKVSPEERNKLIEIFNSPENIYGEKIKVLLISSSGAEGLDLKYIRQIHILEPYWDWARILQIIGRGVRTGSHDELDEDDRDVQPYLYIATAPEKAIEEEEYLYRHRDDYNYEELEKTRRFPGHEPLTIDEVFYKRAINKHELNEQFKTAIREVAVDCALFSRDKEVSKRECHLCLPTNEILFRDDPKQDLLFPNPCKSITEEEVEMQVIEYNGKNYAFIEDEDAPFGKRFYVEDKKIDGFRPIMANDKIIPELLKI